MYPAEEKLQESKGVEARADDQRGPTGLPLANTHPGCALPEWVPVPSCSPSDPSRPPRAECSRVGVTRMVNRDIPNLEELEQCSHRGPRLGGDAGRGRVPSGPGCRAWANTPSAYCVRGVGGEAFLSSLPRNRGGQPAGCGAGLPWRERGEFRGHLSSASWDSLRARGGAGRGNSSCHVPAHQAGRYCHPTLSAGPDAGRMKPSVPRLGLETQGLRPCFPVAS